MKKKKKNYTNKFIKNQYNRFPFECVEDVCPHPGDGQNRSLLLLLPSHVQIEDDLLNGGPCPSQRSGKTLPLVRLAPHKLIVSLDAVVRVEVLATTLADKHIATVLPNFVLAKHLQRHESFVTDITGVNPLSLLQQHDFPHKLTLKPCRSSCQQMSTLIHVLLKADACLEDNVADDKSDPWCTYKLRRYLSCSVFFLGWRVAGSLVPQKFMILGLGVSLQCGCLTSSW